MKRMSLVVATALLAAASPAAAQTLTDFKNLVQATDGLHVSQQ